MCAIIGSMFVLTFAHAAAQGPVEVIEYDLDYSDPASDVTWVYGNGSMENKGEPKDVNIKWVRSEPVGQTLKLTIELSSPGQIQTDEATSYMFNIYTTAGNQSHFVVNYSDGDCTLYTNTSSTPVNSSVEYSINGGDLVCFVNVSDLGTIESYNLDASAETVVYENATVGWVLKKDFGWAVPGNPGTAPGDELDEGGGGLPGFGLLTILAAGAVALGIMTVSRKKR
jgi:hypothetical protein